MKTVFLGLFCLGFLGHIALAHHPEGDPALIFSFQKIPAGSFIMGFLLDEEDRGEDEVPVKVTISKPFEIMTTEVTQAQYFLVTGETPSHFSYQKDCEESWDELRKICPNHPVESVSWEKVQDFIKKLNASAGIKDCQGIPEDPKACYRLPTEAEWEWAARAGTETAYFFGDDPSLLAGYAVYKDNSGGRTHEVTSGWNNPNGLHGIYGNVWEWVEDSYKIVLEGGINPLNRESKSKYNGGSRVIRGGGWSDPAKHLRSVTRDKEYSNRRYDNVGFRLVRTL